MNRLFLMCLRVHTYILLTFGSVLAQNEPAQLDKLFLDVSSDPGFHFNGAVLVADGDKIIYQNAIGYADLSSKQKNTVQTRFQLASLSKIFTATAVMQLAEKERFRMEDPL